MLRVLMLLVALFVFISPIEGQTAPRIVFDAISIRESPEPLQTFWVKFTADEVNIKAQTVRELLCEAFANCDEDAFRYLPAWCNKIRYDIRAKVVDHTEGGIDTLGRDEQHALVRMILQENFGLQDHLISQQKPVLILNQDPKSLGAKLVAPSDEAKNRGLCLIKQLNQGYLSIDGCSFKDLAYNLGRVDGKLVVDESAIQGRFQFTLHWSDDLNADSTVSDNWPNIYKAVRDQLGLQIRSGFAPVQVVVIDNVKQPELN